MRKNTPSLLRQLKEQGHRMTKARQAMLRAIEQATMPLSALEIHALLAKKGIEIDKVTAYRAFQFLEKEAVLHCVQFKDGVKRYCLASQGHHHHLICTECNAVQAMKMDNDLDAIERKIRREKSFRVKSHTLEFYGLCARCS